ncbi:MAG: pyrroloquinoline quinone-dependent dehydrogenase [Gemmatimonadaceae bacterium]
MTSPAIFEAAAHARPAAMPVARRVLAVVIALGLTVVVPACAAHRAIPAGAPLPDNDWPAYGRDRGGERFSPLAQIDRANVARLAVAWRFRTGEAGAGYETGRRTSFESTPLVVNGTLYLSSALGRVFALDAATGAERWRFNPGVPRVSFGDFANRGVSYWVDPAARRGSHCAARIFIATIDGRLIALDAATGSGCPSFGDGGSIDLRRGLRNKPFEFEEYEVTSPPAVVNGTLVVGSAVADNNRTDAASGEVRAYDARSGAFRWSWDPVPQDSTDAAYATWNGAGAHHTGAANAWSVIAADSSRDMVYVPTSSPSPDYYGGLRLGDNRYANSIVALHAATGKVAWSFQTVHHDLWDYDNAAPPLLTTIRRGGRDVPVVMQATKTGMLYVLDRDTGVPIFPVEERAVPRSAVDGETASPTQPFSSIAPLSPHRLTADDVFGADSADRAACRATIASLRNEGIFTPPSVEGTLVVPSNIGGAHWGGLAFDRARQLVIVPVNEVAAQVQLLPRAVEHSMSEPGWEYAEMRGTPFMMRRRIVLSPKGVPCTRPPFGSLVAVSMATGAIAWRVPLGTPRPPKPLPAVQSAIGAQARSGLTSIGADAGAAALAALGSPNLGGAIVTAGGLVFIGATLDQRVRAFDVENGHELWQALLPAGGKATPMTYMVNGRQYVAIAAGGDGAIFGKGDELVVFALPSAR